VNALGAWPVGIFLPFSSNPYIAYFETISTLLPLKNAIFWDVAPCRSCVNRRFGGTNRLRRLTQALHGPTSQKTAFFIVTGVKTSNLTWCYSVFPLPRNVLTEPLLSNEIFHLVTETCVTEPLTSNGLFRLSGIMSQY
jgi:hypothetical protein